MACKASWHAKCCSTHFWGWCLWIHRYLHYKCCCASFRTLSIWCIRKSVWPYRRFFFWAMLAPLPRRGFPSPHIASLSIGYIFFSLLLAVVFSLTVDVCFSFLSPHTFRWRDQSCFWQNLEQYVATPHDAQRRLVWPSLRSKISQVQQWYWVTLFIFWISRSLAS